MPGKPYSARAARVDITLGAQTVTLLASRVTISTNSDLIDVSNFTSGVDALDPTIFYGDWIGGITSAEVMIEAFDSDADGVANNDIWALQLRAGKNTAVIKVWVDEARNKFWNFPSVSIIDIGSDVEIHGAVKLHIRARSRGRIDYPA